MLQINEKNAIDYLVQQRFLSPQEAALSQAVELKGGVSNITIQIQTPKGRYVLKQALGKLRVQMDWYSDVRRIYVETDCMRLLGALIGTTLIPEIFFEDRENYLYVMASAPPGATTWKQRLLSGGVNLNIAEKLGRLLGDIHQKTHERAPEIARQFNNDEFFIQLRVDPYYNTIANVHAELSAQIHALSQQMFDNKRCLVHGDYSPKNILVQGEQILLIDFEVAHYGDPVFDLAFFLTHLRLKAFHLPHHQAVFYEAIRRFWKAYIAAAAFINAEQLELRFIRHWGCVLLARLDGKSPAEYLQPATKDRIRPYAKRLIRGEFDNIEACLGQGSP
jgi:5-methylthioribose kinase